jgi:hypothetical protein
MYFEAFMSSVLHIILWVETLSQNILTIVRLKVGLRAGYWRLRTIQWSACIEATLYESQPEEHNNAYRIACPVT